MGFTLCNSRPTYKVNITDLSDIIRFAKLFGWIPQVDSSYICCALSAGIEEVKSGRRDDELLDLYPERSGKFIRAKVRKEIIKLSKEFMKFHQYNRYMIDPTIIKLHEKNGSEYKHYFGFSICTEGEAAQGAMHITEFGWAIIQSLAYLYGWVPQGIWPGIRPLALSDLWTDWSSSYNINMWHDVSIKDTYNLTYALREAREGITRGQRNQDLIEAHECEQDLFKFCWSRELKYGGFIPDAAEFRKQTIKFLQKFIEFCDTAPLWIG